MRKFCLQTSKAGRIGAESDIEGKKMRQNRAEWIEEVRQKDIILFGAGTFAKNFYQDFKEELHIQYCISNDTEQTVFAVEEEEICPVYRVEKAVWKEHRYIILCGEKHEEMERQLSAYGLRYGMDYIDSGLFRVIASNKKIAVFYGVCYMRALYHCLMESSFFTDIYDSYYWLNYQTRNVVEQEIFQLLLRMADLYICHKAMTIETRVYLSLLRQSCRVIRIPLVFFNGYHPKARERVWEDNIYSIVSSDTYFGPFITPDDVVNRCIKENQRLSEILKRISDVDYYGKDFLEQNYRREIRKIEVAETGADIRISDYLLENHGRRRLFLNEKHISNYVIVELAERVLEALELDRKLPEEELCRRRLLYTTEVPVYPSVIEKLSLTVYGTKPKYRMFVFGTELDVSFEEYIERYYDYCVMMKRCMDEGYFPGREGI